MVNNLRDIPTDRAAGKRTIAVMVEKSGAQIEYAALLGVAYVVPIQLALLHGSALLLAPLMTLPLAVPLLRTVRAFGDPRQLNAVLKGTARLAFVFAVLFAFGLLWT